MLRQTRQQEVCGTAAVEHNGVDNKPANSDLPIAANLKICTGIENLARQSYEFCSLKKAPPVEKGTLI